MNKIFTVLLCVICINAFGADETENIRSETDLSFMFATSIAMELSAEQRIIFPFSLGTHPLVAQNNITAKFGAKVTPMTFNFLTDAVWSPLPFANVTLGAEIGAGWNFDLYGFPMKGMGLYQRDDSKEPPEWADGGGLDGAVWKAHGGGTLLFDMAAFLPGEWNHLVMKIENALWYQNYTKAVGAEQWYFKGGDGINQNWFSYYFSGFIGYQMPIFLDMAGFMFESTLPLYNPQSGKSIDREPEMLCSFLVEFKIGKLFTILTLTEIENSIIHPVTPDYERQWKFSCVRVISTWHLKR